MAKLNQYGMITPEEYKAAEASRKFRITDNLVCSYCQEAVTVLDNDYLYCPRHLRLRLSIHSYPGYPAIPKDVPRYKQMHFYFAKMERNSTLFSEDQHTNIANNKGCPFCDRYMLLRNSALEDARDLSLLNQAFLCPDCGVAFRIVVEQQDANNPVLGLHFQPEPKYIEEKRSPENVPEAETEIDPATLSDAAFAIWFLENYLVEDNEHFQPYQMIYSCYEVLCSTYNREPLEDRKLYQKLRGLYSVENTRRRVDHILKRGFVGIRCVDLIDD